MTAIGIHRDGISTLTMTFEKGEKCFCCNKIFEKKTDVMQSFSNQNEYEEYYWNIEINSNKQINK